MRKLKPAVILFLIILSIPSILFAWEGSVAGVTDGDTIKVLKAGKEVDIRLAAIDCPEMDQPYGQAAKKFTADLVAGKMVKVWPTDTDTYGRTVAFVFVGDTDLNKELLKAGLAWHYKRYSRNPELAKLEFQARVQKIGIWSEPDPLPPWKWKKNRAGDAKIEFGGSFSFGSKP
jgi:micrococcal nuclease